MKRLSGGRSLIPGLMVGEEEKEMAARAWEVERAIAIAQGKGTTASRGGRNIMVGE